MVRDVAVAGEAVPDAEIIALCCFYFLPIFPFMRRALSEWTIYRGVAMPDAHSWASSNSSPGIPARIPETFLLRIPPRFPEQVFGHSQCLVF